MNTETPTRLVDLATGRYERRVSRIVEARRKFNSSSGQKYVHDIYFADDNGDEYRGEHVTFEPYQSAFTVGEVCCFTVTDSKMHEIQKCRPAAQSLQPYNESDREDDFSPIPINVSGKSYTFALAYAKDIAAARIRSGQMTGEEPEFMRRILTEAWQMHQWLMDPKDPGPEPEPLPF